MRLDRIARLGILPLILSACSGGAPPAISAPTAAATAARTVTSPVTAPAVAGPTPGSVAAAVPTLATGPSVATLPDPNTVPVPPAGTCHIVDGIADHACTPGLVNPNLTPAQVCAPGFSTSTIRPPVSYTDVLKKRLMASYGLSQPPQYYELDHELSLEDLGHPYDPRNLWPQPRGKTLPGSQPTGAEPNAEEKDQVETAIHAMICADPSNSANIATLQARLVADWTQFRKPSIAALVADDQPTKLPEP